MRKSQAIVNGLKDIKWGDGVMTGLGMRNWLREDPLEKEQLHCDVRMKRATCRRLRDSRASRGRSKCTLRGWNKQGAFRNGKGPRVEGHERHTAEDETAAWERQGDMLLCHLPSVNVSGFVF